MALLRLAVKDVAEESEDVLPRYPNFRVYGLGFRDRTTLLSRCPQIVAIRFRDSGM